MSRGHAEEIAAQLMKLVIGVKRRARGEYDGQTLPYPQHAVLKRLDKGGAATTADLARAEMMTPQAMGGLVAALGEAGYVAKRDDARDARRKVLTLTAAGRKALAANREARNRWLASLVSERFDAREQRTIAEALSLLGDVFSE